MRVVVNGWAWLDKRDLSKEQVLSLRERLTFQPRQTYPDGPVPEPVGLYQDLPDRIGVPRAWFERTTGQEHIYDWRLSEGAEIWPAEAKFVGALRAEQAAALRGVLAEFRECGEGIAGGIVKAPTGWGKSVWACALLSELAVPTLIIVHREHLLEHWSDTIKQFLPGVQVGKIQGKCLDYEGKHVVVGMVETLASASFTAPEAFYDHFGFVLTDEVHTIGAPTWSKIPPLFAARWRLGMSATPSRKDRMDAVFSHHIGQLLYVAEEFQLRPRIRRVPTGVVLSSYVHGFNPVLWKEPTLQRMLRGHVARNRLIVDRIIEAYRAGRKLLVTSKLLKHLEALQELLLSEWDRLFIDEPRPRVHYLHAQSTREDRTQARQQADILFATVQYVREGFNMPRLDTLFITLPVADVEQLVGRILRPCEGKKPPIVVDFRDDSVPLFARWGKTRDRLYARIAESPGTSPVPTQGTTSGN